MRRHILVSVMMIVVVSSEIGLFADESKEVLELKGKVKSLEDRVGVAKLEEIISSRENKDQSLQNSADLRERVQKRFEQDRTTYSKEELMEIERLYQGTPS